MADKREKVRRINTPSSTALAAVVHKYRAFNDTLENSLDATEYKYPTKLIVIERLERAAKVKE